MKLSIVILNYLTFDKTISCLESLQYESEIIDHVIIVDNDSNNNSVNKISSYLNNKKQEVCLLENLESIPNKKHLLYSNAQNSGYAQGNNIGINIALKLNSNYILILNNDVKMYPEAIEKLINFMSKKDRVGCVGPIIKEGDSYDYNFARQRLKWYDHFFLSGIIKRVFPQSIILKHHFIAYNKIPNKPFRVDMISGSCMLFSSSALNAIDGFDPNTFLYYEEAIISEKLRENKLETFVIPSSQIEHEHAGSIKRVKPSKILKYSLQSQFYYLHKIRHYNKIIAHFIMSGQYLTYVLVLLINNFKE